MNLILCSKRKSIRERWSSILSEHGYVMHQTAFFENIEELILNNRISLIMLHQPSLNIKKVGELCKNVKPAKIFIFSDDPKEEDGLYFLRRFIAGYANTYIAPGRLSEAVKIILSGKVWFNQEIINKLIYSINSQTDQGSRANTEQGLSSLSEREKEIALLVSEGLSNHLIAEKLFISERTVKTHLSTIFHKTNSHNRLQLALLIHGITN